MTAFWIAAAIGGTALYFYGVGVTRRMLQAKHERAWAALRARWTTPEHSFMHYDRLCTLHGRTFASPTDTRYGCYQCKYDGSVSEISTNAWWWPAFAAWYGLRMLLKPLPVVANALIRAGEQRTPHPDKQAVEAIIRESQRA